MDKYLKTCNFCGKWIPMEENPCKSCGSKPVDEKECLSEDMAFYKKKKKKLFQ